MRIGAICCVWACFPTALFAAEVLEFTGPGCLACQRMSPVIDRLKRSGYRIRPIDIRRTPDLARQLKIELLPTFVLIEKGREVRRIVGVTSEAQLRLLAASTRVAPATGRPGTATRPPTRSPRSKTSTVQAPRPQAAPIVRANLAEEGPLSSCVRLRLLRSDGHEFASGTVIGSRPGRAVILTCGHLFRDRNRAGELVVEIFDEKRIVSYRGRLLDCDLDADVALVEISAKKILPVARVADEGFRLAQGQRLISFGCNGGEQPTRETVMVTRLNRYLGPDNVECTGVPLQGRSGGGLFDSAGRVVGVCFAADPTYQRGLYAGLGPIQQLLSKCQLTSLYRAASVPASGRRAVTTAASRPPMPTASGERDRPAPPPAFPGFAAPSPRSATSPLATRTGRAGVPVVPPRATSGRASQTKEVAAALAAAPGAEVICIIRSLENPRQASKVVIINRASRKFVADLVGELDAQARPTSGFQPRTDSPPIPGAGHSISPGP